MTKLSSAQKAWKTRRANQDKWIQKSRNIKKKGALHKMLGIPPNQRLPVTLLKLIKRSDVGSTLKNPTRSGKRYIKVTYLLKQRTQWALNVRK